MGEKNKDVILPKAKRHTDYREMLEKQKDIEGVLIATPDHMHAPIALAAMELGKHVYVQKPLTWCVAEARQLAERARETRVATQMGNQGHSLDDARKAVEYIWAGAIGEVREIHIWTNRPLGFWPQGVPRPVKPNQPGDEMNAGSRGAPGCGDCGKLSGAGKTCMGFVFGRRPQGGVSPDLSSV
jgi:predicted dehydrogenase